MAEKIEVVIKIPEYYLTHPQDYSCLAECVRRGVPLPKGHGDLKDMEDIYEALEGWNDDTGWIVDAIDCHAQTIIEADKEENKCL